MGAKGSTLSALWTYIAPGVFWCKGCGCMKIVKEGKPTKYKTPSREFKRRLRMKNVRRTKAVS